MLKVTRCEFVHNLPCEQVSNRLTELEAENAKLREQVRALICATDPHDRERLIINAVELLGEMEVG